MNFKEFLRLDEVWINTDITKDLKNISNFSKLLGKQVIDKNNPQLVIKEILTTLPYGKVAIANVSSRKMNLVGIDKDGNVSVIAELNANGEGWKVYSLVAVEDNKFPAAKMYAAFVRSGYMLISGSQQSFGGMAVWKKLSKEKGVHVYGWNKATKQPVNLGDSFDDESDSHALDVAVDSMRQEKKTASDKDKKVYDAEIKHVSDVSNNVVLIAIKK